MLTVRSQKELIKQKVGISYKILVRSDLSVSCDQIVGSNPGHKTIDFCTSSKKLWKYRDNGEGSEEG